MELPIPSARRHSRFGSVRMRVIGAMLALIALCIGFQPALGWCQASLKTPVWNGTSKLEHEASKTAPALDTKSATRALIEDEIRTVERDESSSLAAGYKRAAVLAKLRFMLGELDREPNAESAIDYSSTGASIHSIAPNLTAEGGSAGQATPQALVEDGNAWEGCKLGLTRNAANGASIRLFTATPNSSLNIAPTFLTSVSNKLTSTSSNSYMAVGHYEDVSGPGRFRAFRVTDHATLPLGDITALPLNTNSCGYSESFAHGVSEAGETIVGAACVGTNCETDKDLRPVRWDSSSYSMRTVPPPSSWNQSNWARTVVHGESVGNSGEATAVSGDGAAVVGWAQRAFPTPAAPGTPPPANNLARNPFRWLRGTSVSAAGTATVLPLVKGGLERCADPASTAAPSSLPFACFSATLANGEQAGAMAISRDGNLVVGYQKTYERGESNNCERWLRGTSIVDSPIRQVGSRAFFWHAGCSPAAEGPRGLLSRPRSFGNWCPSAVSNHPRGIARGLSPEGARIVGEDYSDRINHTSQGNPSQAQNVSTPPHPVVEFDNILSYVSNRHRWLPRHFASTSTVPLIDQADVGAWSQEAMRWNFVWGSLPHFQNMPAEWGLSGTSSQIRRDSRLRDASLFGLREVGQTFLDGNFAGNTSAREARAAITGLGEPSTMLRDLKGQLIQLGVNPDIGNSGGSEWHLTDARSISPDGKVVVGEALCHRPNSNRGVKVYAYIARVP